MVEMTEPDAWRREIDVTIETRLCAAGFERFDGISYSFQKTGNAAIKPNEKNFFLE
jgi:hypothetical protein